MSRGRWDEPGKGPRGYAGLSAYEVAVRNGFVGTEQQWLDSLQGTTTVVEVPTGGGGSGTVTSVSATGSTGLAVGGSPITSSGTLTFTLQPATTIAQGAMSAADKTKLDGIAAGAQPGTVTSVGITGSTGLVVSGSPVTGAGTITLTLDTGLQALASYNTSAFVVQTATNVFAGRTITGTASRVSITNGSGAAGNPVIDIDAGYVGQTSITTLGTVATGTWNATPIGVSKGGTGLTALGTADQVLGVDAAGTAPEYKTITAGANVTVTHGVGTITIAATGGGGGGVTSVDLGASTGLTPSGGPITSSGSLTYTLSANLQAWHGLATSAKQDADADLTAVAALSTNGLATRTAANTWTTRSILGSTNRINVTNGDGISGNITVNISASYVGQATITTLGTITTGTWNGTAIAAANGGTGQTVYAVGDLLYASTTTALSKLADVATGNALLSGGVGVAPAWGKVALTTHVSGVLPVANGGTGQSAPSGTYVPTLTHVTNVASSSTNNNTYVRVGNTVTVSGFLGLTPSATGLVVIDMSIPVASNFATAADLVGAGWNAETASFVPVQIIANTTNDRATISFYTGHTGVRAVGFHFTYTVI